MTLEEQYRLSCYEELTTMGENEKVHLVKDVRTKELFIKKEMPREVAEIYRQLKKENIEGIPQIYEVFEKEELAYSIEEYIHGKNLERMMEEGYTFEEAEVKRIIVDISQILRNLHEQEKIIIHRDIKPSNVVMSKEGSVYLIDFDAARFYDSQRSEDTKLLGTRGYASPEQYGLGQSDARSDIYALGIMMNRLLTKEYPKDKTADGKMGMIIRKCTLWDPDQRYQTVRELQEAFKKIDHPFWEIEEKKIELKKGILGFRTKTPWKMIVAMVSYALYLYICLSMEITDENNIAITGSTLWLDRIFAILIGIYISLYCGNFAGLREKTFGKWGEYPIWRWVVSSVCVVGGSMFLMVIMVILEEIFL